MQKKMKKKGLNKFEQKKTFQSDKNKKLLIDQANKIFLNKNF